MRSLTGGGTDGNEQLTAMVAVVLVVLLAVLGITIVRIGQLIWLHLFLGLLLLGPVAMKLASTGYRFARYYSGNRTYRLKGPPGPALRLIAPGVVVSTLVVFISGILLLLDGPQSRGRLLLVHKASFIVWLGFTGLHVLGHLPGLGGTLRRAAVPLASPPSPSNGLAATAGGAGRWLAVASAVVAGVVVAIVLLPEFSSWTAHLSLWQDHER